MATEPATKIVPASLAPIEEAARSVRARVIIALLCILLVGVALVADGLGFHIPRGYLYFAIAFSLVVELLNIRARSKSEAAAEKPH